MSRQGTSAPAAAGVKGGARFRKGRAASFAASPSDDDDHHYKLLSGQLNRERKAKKAIAADLKERGCRSRMLPH